MGIYANVIVTTEGEKLQTRATAGETKITFTKIALGSGIAILDKESTELTKQEQESAFDSKTIAADGQTLILEATPNNIGIENAYDVREIGIFAKDDADNECLYAVINTNIYEYYDHMQAYESEADYEEITYRVNLKITDPEQVTIEINKDKTEVVNNQTTTQPGKALDARQANPNIEGSLANQLAAKGAPVLIQEDTPTDTSALWVW